MRRKRKPKKKNCEAHFLERRRKAVAAAATKSVKEKMENPKWLQSLSAKLWTKSHTAEQQFNHKKHARKALLAYQAGLYTPANVSKKRKMDTELQQFQKAEAKKRRDYDRNIEKRCQAARVSKP